MVIATLMTLLIHGCVIASLTTPRRSTLAMADQGHFPVPVMEHRILPESSVPVENTKLALAGAEFHPEQI
jgi:hypothetical protein